MIMLNNCPRGDMENNYFALLANDVKKLWNGLDGNQKLGMLALIVITIVAATFFLSKAMEPDWVVLYSDLSEVDSISIVEGLKKNGYRYKISEDHKAVLVPSNVRDEMRVFVAENDLIKNEIGGFEILDNMQLGSTDFKNKLTRQRIFQGELVRSIEKIDGIKFARVQLAEPERSIFDDNDTPPTASVVLILEPGYKIKSSQVKAIKNLVAYSVARMTPEQVFVTDQNGNVLSDETSKNSTDMESFKSNLEKDTAKKVSSVLEKIVGKGNVSVQVNADIDFNSAKSTIESYMPITDDKGVGVVSSSQTEVETYENPQNIQNITTNVHLTPPQTVINRNLNYSKQKTAVNYSVSKEVKQVIYAPGTVKRLSIAVAVNKVLTEDEKEEIKNLVLSASGVDYSRGDVISVSGLQFEGAVIDKTERDDFSKQYQQEQILNFLSTSVIPLIIILLLGGFALLILKSFVNKMPTMKRVETRVHHENAPEIRIEDFDRGEDNTPKIEINRKEIQSQKDQSINELNDAVMASPEEAAKLITSYIRD